MVMLTEVKSCKVAQSILNDDCTVMSQINQNSC